MSLGYPESKGCEVLHQFHSSGLATSTISAKTGQSLRWEKDDYRIAGCFKTLINSEVCALDQQLIFICYYNGSLTIMIKPQLFIVSRGLQEVFSMLDS